MTYTCSPAPKRKLIIRPLVRGFRDDLYAYMDAMATSFENNNTIDIPTPVVHCLPESCLPSIITSDATADDTTTDDDDDETTIDSPLEPSPVGSVDVSPVVTPSQSRKRSSDYHGRRYQADNPQGEKYYCPYSVEAGIVTVRITTPDGTVCSGTILRKPSTSRPSNGYINNRGSLIPFTARLIHRKHKRMIICVPCEYSADIVKIGIESDGQSRPMLSMDGPHRKFMGRKYEDIAQ